MIAPSPSPQLEILPVTFHGKRSPVKASTRRIAIVADAYFESLYSGIAAYARATNWDLEPAMIRNPGYLPQHGEWSGALAIVCRKSSLQWLAEMQCPTVFMLDPSHLPVNTPFIDCDYEAAGRYGAQHLLELGNIEFAFYRAHVDMLDALAMQRGFSREIEQNGFSVHHFNLPSPRLTGFETMALTTRAQRVAWLIDELKEAKFPMAVMAEDDRFAVDLVFAARALGLRMPEDLAILGAEVDRLILSSISEEISSVDVNLYEVGYRAAQLLHRMIDGAPPGSHDVPMHTRVAPKGTVVRQSTATFVCQHPAVTAAAMFVRRNFRENISVEDVAAASRMSLRALQVKYPVYVRMGIKEDILRQRLRAAEQLLEQTDLKLAAVASESGFGTLENLCKVFRRRYELTPQEWRLQREARG